MNETTREAEMEKVTERQRAFLSPERPGCIGLTAAVERQRAAADRQLRQKAEAIQDPKLRREVLGALES